MALQRGDAMIATAPPAARWLLIESANAWPRQALGALQPAPEEPAVSSEVARRCGELGYRPVLIRRHGRVDRAAVRRYALVDCRPGHESVRWGELPTDAYLLNVLEAVATNSLNALPDLQPPTQEPIYLVCTHGRHDACCAVRGRPVAAALAGAYPDRTWECSHIGGDRFAGNVVVLPHALFYGQVPPSRAVEVAKHHAEGRVVPDLLRGSGIYPPAVQAAQHYARLAGHSDSLTALRPTQVQQLANQHYKVTLTTTSATAVVIEVSVHFDTVDARLTCAGKAPVQVRRFDLHGIDVVGG
ncbi:sucrase ferredoxin [Kribbella sp. NPDC051587]|uniref:sucrase ferredoxin n=1 Tax=Kribbella sp. NPDC051587 TaxID=3364119 RepID=UPI0037ABBB92